MSPSNTNATTGSILRRVIHYHLDNFSYDNALFFAERLVAQDSKAPGSTYLLALCHFRLGDFHSAFEVAKTAALKGSHLGCSWIYAQSCLRLRRYREGILVLNKCKVLWHQTSNMGKHGTTIRSPFPDAPAVLCLLGKLHLGYGDTAMAGETFDAALKLNPLMWDAFTALCAMGVNVNVPNIYKLSDTITQIFDLGGVGTGMKDSSNRPITNKPDPPSRKALASGPINGNDAFSHFQASTASGADRTGVGGVNEIQIETESPDPLLGSGSSNPETRPTRTTSLKYSDKNSSKTNTALKNIMNLLEVMAIGHYHLSKFDCADALKAFERLPRAHQETPWVLAQMGRTHFERAAYADAEKCALGNAWSKSEEHEQAVKCFKRAAQLDPNMAYAYTLQGHEYMATEDYDRALRAYRRALSVDKRHYNAHYGIGKVHERLGNLDKAHTQYLAAANINPTNAVLACCIGSMLEKQNHLARALRYYGMATELTPKAAQPRFKRARALLARGDLVPAKEELMILRDLAPDEAMVHFLLGNLYKSTNEKGLAIRHYTFALALDPKASPQIKEAIEGLEDREPTGPEIYED
ncbi:hypothetical protein SAPIO_CDS7716 [Scedosporium apiospermum]|uniref:Uncharacterized protein n=1 Tax=Pseudallescheria apiosperma TaxID=563466 RepID=A0A084G2I8_PSEDA|nr:uncharacterized protein SAPIO_CDS7716 [Scedosporium apiospermum]KEZ41550.1 hypothetical protein SAPIO_CDS7716 [Scedosporium apiospermum]